MYLANLDRPCQIRTSWDSHEAHQSDNAPTKQFSVPKKHVSASVKTKSRAEKVLLSEVTDFFTRKMKLSKIY